MNSIRFNEAVAAANVRAISDLSYKYPDLLMETNAKGETPLRAYLNGGGRDRGMITALIPPFQPDWARPSWYGLPGAWPRTIW